MPTTHRHATEDPLATTTTAMRTRWTTQNHSKQRVVHLPTTSNAAAATAVRSVLQATATHVSVTRTVADSRNEQFDASTERDDASLKGEDEDDARHRTGHGDCVVNDELDNTVYVFNADNFSLVNINNNGDLHLPGTADISDGQADAATHDRSVVCQYEPVSSTDSLLCDLSSDILGQNIENIPVNTPAQDSLLDLDKVSMVTWGTAFEDPQMMDDDVSPQGNNDATPEVPPTTSDLCDCSYLHPQHATQK